ncbi:uncharacterized protein LOC128883790 [Hylaeus volcanicus]|uniref:uncharacterized protein LOC128883790 n=1 Tax=Hylaeus volcanicus TaxID=313075 RepID=UPI0023B7FE31|nr:uncharacterized protein LOC128883790 [Hylaeus volcanicus]
MGFDVKTGSNDMNDNVNEKKKEKENASRKCFVNENHMSSLNTQPETEQFDEENRGFVRKQYRGFTITVSPPEALRMEESVTTLTKSNKEPDLFFSKHTEGNYLCDDFNRDFTLERTESCLPELEDMLGVEELRQMFDTSERHREVQSVLVMEDSFQKYQCLVNLVKRSYESQEWRKQASTDLTLVDSLVLFCRQKAFFLEVPEEETNAAIVAFRRGRSSCLSQSFTSLSSLSRASSQSFNEAPASQKNSIDNCSNAKKTNELKTRIGCSIALISVTLKLIRNLCVESTTCQMYLFEHRFLDFLTEYLDVILEAGYNFTSQKSSWEEEWIWVVKSIVTFPEVFLQCLTNGISGNLQVQEHLLKRLFPDGLLRIITVTHHAELISCFLYNLWMNQSYSVMGTTPDENLGSSIIIYCLLALHSLNKEGSTYLQERWGLCCKKFNKSLLDELSKNEAQSSDSRFDSNVWNAILFKYILQQTNCENISILNRLLGSLLQYDASQLCGRLLRFPSRSKSICSSPRGSLESLQSNVKGQEDTFYKKFCDQIANVPKSDIIENFFLLLEKAVDKQDTTSCDCFIASCLSFPKLTLENVLFYILKGFNVTLWSPSEDISKKSFHSALEFTTTLSSMIAKSDKNRAAFNSMFAIPLIVVIFPQLEHNILLNNLKTENEENCLDQNYGNLLPVKLCLRLIANLSYKNSEIQDEVDKQKGIEIIVNHLFYNRQEPFIREAGIFAIRCCCESHTKNRNSLQDFLISRHYQHTDLAHSILGNKK